MPPQRQVVEAPPVGQPTIGLLRSAVVTEDGPSARWFQRGLTYESEACAPAGIADPCSPGSGYELDENDGGGDTIDGDAFVIWAADRCSMLDNGRDAEGRARRRLASFQEVLVSREMWDGAQHRASAWDGHFLADATADGTDVISATAVALRDALAALEEYLATRVPQGMIHAHPNLVTLWDSLNLLRREGARIFTVQDTIVVPGRGYTGSAPSADGTADPVVDGTGATAYAYATSIVHVRLGPVNVTRSEDRAVNTRTVRAFRPAVFSFDRCAHAAINVDMADRS